MDVEPGQHMLSTFCYVSSYHSSSSSLALLIRFAIDARFPHVLESHLQGEEEPLGISESETSKGDVRKGGKGPADVQGSCYGMNHFATALLVFAWINGVFARPSASPTVSPAPLRPSTTYARPISGNNATSNGSCVASCRLVDPDPPAAKIAWASRMITATATYATVIAVVDQYNSTSFTTKTITSANITLPTDTNEAGTVTTQITAFDEALGREVTQTIAYPNTGTDYVRSVIWTGVLPTSTNGSTVCQTASASTTQSLPSHPFLPTSTGTADPRDPRGWHYYAYPMDWPDYKVRPSLFPSFAPLHECLGPTRQLGPEQAAEGTSFVAVTTTSHIVRPPKSHPKPTVPPSYPKPDPQSQPQPKPKPDPQPEPKLNPKTNPNHPAPQPQPAPHQSAPKPHSAPNVGSPIVNPQHPGAQGGSDSASSNNGANGNAASDGNGPKPPVNNNGGSNSNAGALGPLNENTGGESGGRPAAAPGSGNQGSDLAGQGGGSGSSSNSKGGGSQGGAGGSASSNGNSCSSGAVEAAAGAGLPLVVAGSTIKPSHTTIFAGDGVTLAPGSMTTVGGAPVSLGADGSFAVIGGTTQTFPAGLPAQLTVGGQTLTPTAAGAPFYVVDGQTVAPGRSAVTANAQVVSIAGNGQSAIVNGATQTLRSGISNSAVITAPDISATPLAGGGYVVAGQTLTPGGVVTANGQPISLAADGRSAVVHGATQTIGGGIGGAAMVTAPGKSATSAPGDGYIIEGQTLTPGGITTANGQTISLAENGQSAIVNGVTQTLGTSQGEAGTITASGVTAAATGGSYMISGQTLTPGGVIKIDGQTISLAANGQSAVVNDKTETLASVSADATSTAAGASGMRASSSGSGGVTGTKNADATASTAAGASLKPAAGLIVAAAGAVMML